MTPEIKTLKWISQNPVPDNNQTLYPATATVMQFGERKFSQTGKGATKVTLQDLSGQFVVKVWDGNAGQIDSSLLGKPVNFNLKASTFKGRTYLQGFWEIDNQTLNRPPQAPQVRHDASQSTSTPEGQSNAYDQQQVEKRRSVGLSYALEFLRLPLYYKFQHAEDAALHIAEFVETGQIPAPPWDGEKEEPPARESGEDDPT